MLDINIANTCCKPKGMAFFNGTLPFKENKFYSFGKRATNLQDWAKNATDSLTVGRYKNLNNATNYQQFKQGLRQKHYNSRPQFYNVEMNRGRDKNKQIVNQYNQQHGLPLIAGIINYTNNDLA